MASLSSRFWVTVAIAVPCLAFGAFDFIRTLSFVLHAQRAQASVVSERNARDGLRGFPIVVTFSDSEDIVHTATIYYGQPRRHPSGSSVDVLYEPFDPVATARHGGFMHLWAFPGALMLVGSMGLIGASVIRTRGY